MTAAAADPYANFLNRAVWFNDLLDMMAGQRMTVETADRIAQEGFYQLVLYLASLPPEEADAWLATLQSRPR
jgi:hypothetical protein